MERWVAFALVSMAFAGATGVIAKLGLGGISAELGLAVRTVFVFVLTLGFAAVTVPRSELARLTPANLGWLAASALTTTVSWIYYYKAIKLGDVSTVAIIDKGSLIVAVGLAALLLGEPITPRVGLGLALVLAGLLVVSSR